jgi:hypothetical protein
MPAKANGWNKAVRPYGGQGAEEALVLEILRSACKLMKGVGELF